jgi:UDP-N-acetylmuramoylalanine--D-glutamate ligase
MKKLILGFGVSGKAAALLLRKRGEEVVIVDRKPAEGVLLDRADFPLNGIDQLILSPGVPLNHPIVVRAMEAGIEVIGEMELGARLLKNRAVGVTGANGKTTTVLLTTHILKQAGKKARALGNVGDPLSSYLTAPNPDEILILELSSFQLETLHARCLDAAVVLNITPNHLDRYPSMEAYAKAKALIANCLKKGAPLYLSKQVREEFGALFPKEVEKEIEWKIPLVYTHEMPALQTIQAAYFLCSRFEVADEEFEAGLKTFKKPAHRIEWVADIAGVSYYNDSKSSNVHSTVHAVERFDRSIVLIAGGVHKGSSYRPWIESFKGKVKKIIAYGEAASIMEGDLSSAFDFQRVGDFADAVDCARLSACEKDVVLLSPGCSSYDQFKNYEQRGEEFKRLVRLAEGC